MGSINYQETHYCTTDKNVSKSRSIEYQNKRKKSQKNQEM